MTRALQRATLVAPNNYLSGLAMPLLANAPAFTVAPGLAADSTNAEFINLTAPFSKTSSAWAAGTGNGGLDTGTIAAGFYHVHLIKNPATQAVDVLVSLSATAPTLPSGYTLFRRIGSQYWNGSNWAVLLQRGQEFLWNGTALDVNVSNLGTTLTNYTLASVPAGVQVQAILNVIGWSSTQGVLWWLHDKGIVDQAPSYTIGATGVEVTAAAWGNATEIRVWTDNAGGVAARASAASTTFRIITRGWFDPLGK